MLPLIPSILTGAVRECSIIECMTLMSNANVAPSQTLDRGLACLDFVATSDRGVSVDATAEALGLHRSIVYRLLRTLELRHLVEREADGDFLPGTSLAVLSRSVRRSLRAAAAPVLAEVAEDLQMTSFLVVADGDEAVTVDSVEPTSLNAHVACRPGTRQPSTRCARPRAARRQPSLVASGLISRRGMSAGRRVGGRSCLGWRQSPCRSGSGPIAVLWLAGPPSTPPQWRTGSNLPPQGGLGSVTCREVSPPRIHAAMIGVRSTSQMIESK